MSVQGRHEAASLSKSALMLSPCIYWALPEAKWYDDRYTDKSDRDKGTNFHRRIDQFIYQLIGRSAELQEGQLGLDSAGKATAETSDTQTVLPPLSAEEEAWDRHAERFVHELRSVYPNLLSEVPLAIDWSAGKAETITVKNREYPNWPGYQFGTVDLVCWNEDKLLVADWKTGGSDSAEEQLLSCLAGVVKSWKGTIPSKFYISCLSVNAHGVWPDEREVTPEELDSHWQAMQWQWEAIQAGKGTPQPGVHCSTLYCPHLSHCAAVKGLVLEASEGEQGLLKPESLVRAYRMTDAPRTDEEAGFVMERVSAAKRQLNYYTEALKDYCRKGGTAVSGKFEWGPGGDGFRWRKRKSS